MAFTMCNDYYVDSRGRSCYCTNRAFHNVGGNPTDHYDRDLKVSWSAG